MTKQLSKLEVDSSGQLTGFTLHDGSLRSIDFVDHDRVDLKISSNDGALETLVIDRMVFLCANAVREGNILDRMYLWPILKAPNEFVKLAVDRFSLRSRAELLRAAGNDGALFYLESSYGADIIAVVRR